MWLEKLALMTSCLGLAVMAFSWMYYQEDWAMQHKQNLLLLEGQLQGVKHIGDATILSMQQNKTVEIWVPENISASAGNFARIIARQRGETIEAVTVVS